MFEGRDYSWAEPIRISDLHIVKAGDDRNIIFWLEHGLTFATDSEINNQLYQEYHRCYGVYTDPQDQLDEMQSYIDRMRGYWEELYKTTTYDYNPINNYDMTETENTENCSQGESVGSRTANGSTSATGRQYGYNETKPTDVQSESGATSDAQTTSQSDRTRGKQERTLTRSGNIGVMSTQQMIKMQREVLTSVLRDYVHSFLPYVIIK